MWISSDYLKNNRTYPNIDFVEGEVSDVSYNEVVEFLIQDDISENKYVEGVYNCYNFALDIINRSYEAGIRCAYVVVPRDPINHAVIAFNTLDQGVCYFEPQTDGRIFPEEVLYEQWE